MKKTIYLQTAKYFLPAVFILSIFIAKQQSFAQVTKHIPGTTCFDCPKNINEKVINPIAPQNGNHALGMNYNTTACGLNYTTGSVVIEQRTVGVVASPPPGVIQPAPIVIAGIPACATILKAFLYADASGNGVAVTATVKNPLAVSAPYPMAIIGQDVDKCWSGVGYAATYSYRADVTAAISGNGTYLVSGLPVAPSPGPNDIDGATLVIIYSDPGAAYTGTMFIADGAMVSVGTGVSGNITGFTACSASANASVFALLADLQDIAATPVTVNGSTYSLPAASDIWWNYVQFPTTVAAGLNNFNYSVTNSGDCFNVVAIGLYSQTTCNVCTASGLTVTATATTTCIGNNESVTVTGGSGNYSYTWTPTGGNASTASNLAGGTYTVSVTDNAGCKSGTATVTIPNTTGPGLTVNSPTICSGNSATLNATGGLTYTWTPATGLSSTSNPTVTATPSVTTTYTLTGSNGTCTGSVTAVVTVNPLPNITATNGSVCNGAAVTLTATGGTNYTWGPGTGLNTTVGPTVIANPLATTIYTIIGTDANGCTNTATSTVTVVNNPVVTVNNASICLGQQTGTLTATGATTYSWTPAIGLSTTTGSVVTANPVVATTYTIVGSTGTCTAVTTSTVTVNPLPVVTATSATVCAGAVGTLNAGGATTYTWSTLATGASLTASPNTTTNYSVVGADANACFNIATATITVNPLPIVTVNSATICNGATATLTAAGGVNYAWGPAAGLSATVGNPVSANPSSSTVYVVTGTDANNCVNTANATVIVNQIPGVTAASISICSGSVGTLSAANAVNYVWTPPTGLSNTNGGSVTANPLVTTGYTVTGTDANGCVSTATATVTVNTSPIVSVTPQTTSGCAPLCVTFTSTASTNTGNCSWNFGDGGISNSCNPTHCFSGNGMFQAVLSLTDSNGCVGKANATVNVYPVPVANFNATPQPTTFLDPLIQFYDATTQATIATWSWTFGDPLNSTSSVQNPTFNYLAIGVYNVELVVTSDHGCKDSTNKIIKIDDDYMLYVPNAFSPNGDGTNDIFFAKGEGINDFKMYIFDRWGNQVFYSNDITIGWDGRYKSTGSDVVQEDVFVWKIELHDFKGVSRMQSGHVSLLK